MDFWFFHMGSTSRLINKNNFLEFFWKMHRLPLLNQYVKGWLTSDMIAARSLLEIFKSKSYDFNTQFTHVSRHYRTLSIKWKFNLRKNSFNNKVSDSWKNCCKMASLDNQTNIFKKYQKHKIVNNFWQITRPQPFILP